MIDSVKSDPEHLRSAIYELARHKLREQFESEGPGEIQRLSGALETAIQGVEAFSQKDVPNVPALPKPEAAQEQPRVLVEPPGPTGRTTPITRRIDAELDIKESQRGRSGLIPLWRLGLVLVIAITIALAVKYRDPIIGSLRSKPTLVAALPAKQVAPSQPAATLPEAAKPSPLTPTSYGIYAVSGDKLYELQLLPGRAPDPRVAISPLITTPSATTLPDGHLRFIVYRRDSATTAADRADVRVMAKIVRETGFDKAGKPTIAKVDDSWVIRNISIPYRTAPDKSDPDMYDIQSENPDTPLVPGRYALVLKNQAYDFSVAGAVTDPKHCLERLAATNGQFYSQCQKQ
jgi:hypothetical protein